MRSSLNVALPAAALVALTCLASSAPAEDSTPEGDLAKLQGTWTTMGGPKRDVPSVMEIKGNTFTMTARLPQGKRRVIQGKIKIDEKAKPKSWDFVNCKGSLGQPMPDALAIYELDGDTLKIAYPRKSPDDRPAEMPKDEQDPSRATWKRPVAPAEPKP